MVTIIIGLILTIVIALLLGKYLKRCEDNDEHSNPENW